MPTSEAQAAVVAVLRARLDQRMQRISALCHYAYVSGKRERTFKRYFPNVDAIARLSASVEAERRIVNLRTP